MMRYELDEIEARLTASGGPWRAAPPDSDGSLGKWGWVMSPGDLCPVDDAGEPKGVAVSVNLRFDREHAEARVDFLTHVHADMAKLIAELRVALAREERDRAIDESHRLICRWLDNGRFDKARAATNDLARIVGEDHRDVVGLRTMLRIMNPSGEER